MGNTTRDGQIRESRRRRRWALFATTALSAAPLAGHAQLAPQTTPTGGSVVAGSAAIAQAPGNTTVTQSSQRAAIDWQSFNVGAAAQVQFKQPDAGAIALNRVTGGNLSEIDGKITANGQIVLINQSGVVFAKGSQINAESVVVSTANIANAAFMAGNMAFTGAPKPGAKIVNEGSITAGQAGLVGLVAPQVANSGVITAQLGQVVLAGATAFTLDLYGDRLLSLDVTRSVRAVDIGGARIPALVTNSGIILADGGRVTLTASDADALVTQLIDAGGTIRADTLGNRTGTVALSGIGGNIFVAGNLLARGSSGGTGGAVQAAATGTVALAPGAVIDASGAAGGGVVALGTDLVRAVTGPADKAAPAAAAVTVAAGAIIRADATAAGKGGKVTLLSADNTVFLGDISVRGIGGNGGDAEISSRGVIDLGGTVLATAIGGRPGEILLDPQTLLITATGSGGVTGTGPFTIGSTTGLGTSTIAPSAFTGLAGTVILEAASLISVASAIDSTSLTELSLDSAGSIDINAGVTIAGGSIEIDAATSLAIAAPLSASNIGLISGAGGITETGAGAIDAGTLTSDFATIGGNVALTLANNVATLGGFRLTAGSSLAFDNTPNLTIAGTLSTTGAATLNVAGGITETGGGVINAATLSGGATAGDVILTLGNAIGTLTNVTAAGHALDLNDNLDLLAQSLAATSIVLASATLGIGATVSAASSVALATNKLEFSGTGTVTAPTIALAPLSVAEVNLGGAADNELDLTTDLLGSLGGGPVLIIGSAGGYTAQTLAASAPATLPAAFTSLTLDATDTIAIAAGLSATNLALISGGAIGIGASLGATALSLQSTGTVAETDVVNAVTLNGTITAATLQTTGTGVAGAVLNQPSNAITTLGGFTLTAGGDLDLADTIALTIAGALTTTGAATLAAAGAITEATAGALDLGTLTGTAGGDVILDDTAALYTRNNIGSLDGFAVTGGDLGLGDGVSLAVTNLVDANDVTLIAPTINLGAEISAPSLGSDNIALVVDTLTPDNEGVLLQSEVIALAPLTGTVVNFSGGSVTGDLNLESFLFDFIDAPTLAIGAAAGFTAATVAIGATDLPFDTTALRVSATAAINLTGDLIAHNSFTTITLDAGAGSIDLGGAISALETIEVQPILTIAVPVQQLALDAGAGVTQTAGTLRVGTLTGSIGTGNALLTLANSIATLGNFSLSGTGAFSLNDNDALTLAGNLALATLVNGTLTLQGGANFDTAGLTETGAGVIEAGTLTGSIATGSISGGVALNNANDIGTLGTVTVTGAGPAIDTLSLNDTHALDIDGLVSISGAAGAATLGAPTLAETGAGAIDAATLASFAGSMADLFLTLANNIGTLEAFTASSDFDLNSTAALDIAGAVTAETVTLTAPTLNVNAAVTAGSIATPGILALAFDAITTGSALLLAPDGTIAIAPYTTGDDLDVNGASAAGTLDLPQALFGTLDPTATEILLGRVGTAFAAGNITLDGTATIGAPTLVLTTPGGIADTGTLTVGTAGAGTLAFDSAGFSQSGTGAIIAGLLETDGGAYAGNVLLTLASNTISELGTILPNGTVSGLIFALDDATALDVTGPVGAATISLASAGNITIAGTLAANTLGSLTAAASLALASPGTITESSSGLIDANLLTGMSGSTVGVLLLTTANSITTVANLTIASTLDLTDATALTIAGAVTAPQTSLSADGIIFTGLLTAGSIVSLESRADVTELSDGLIDTGSLITAGPGITGNALFDNGNLVAGIGPFTVSNDLSLADDERLSVGGVATGAANLGAPGIDIYGGIGAGAVYLASTDGITEPGGVIDTGLLTGSDSGQDAALNGNNQINTLGGFAANGVNFTLDDNPDLTVAGPVTATGNLIDIDIDDNGLLTDTGAIAAPSVTLTAAAITLAGAITAPDTLALGSLGTIDQTGGALNTGTLTGIGTIGGDVLLTQSNSVTLLGALTLAPDTTLSLTDSGALGIAGPVAAPVVTLDAAGIAFSGPVTAGSLALHSSAGVTQTAGILTAGLLTGNVTAGDVALGQPNGISTLGGFAVDDGNFSLADAANLVVTGPLSLNGGGNSFTAALTTTAPLTIAGSVFAPVVSLTAPTQTLDGFIDTGLLVLASSGTISQTGGEIAAGSLASNGTIGGDLLLTQFNNIGTLGNISLAGTNPDGLFRLFSGTDMIVAGTVAAPNITVTGGALTIAGALDAAQNLSIDTAGTIAETTGTIAAGKLIAGGLTDVILANNNVIASLGNISVGPERNGNFVLRDTAPLAIAGNVSAAGSIDLSDTGAITETGQIDTTLLDLAGTDISLPGNNLIGNLGTVTASGNLLVNGAGGVGALGAANATFTTGGDFNFNGAASVAGNLVIKAADEITQTAGTGPLDAGTLTGSAGQVAAFLGRTDFATIGSFIMQDSMFELAHDTGPLTLLGPLVANVVDLTVSNALTLAGSPDGGLVITGGHATSNTPKPRATDSVIDITGPAPALVQTGVFQVNSSAAYARELGTANPNATLFVTALGGNVQFARSGAGLYAPALDLIIDSGGNGVLAGNVDVAGLLVMGGTSQLDGFIDGLGGQAAAGKGFVSPVAKPALQFNACPIMSVNCTILPIEALPLANPLQNFDIEQRKKRQLNHNVSLPGVATRDF
jgi:filamentous hemagglutinin family protein